jgi:two-component system, chemotaxis family, chemotaxis protein CheY
MDKILIVDDSKVVRHQLKSCLEAAGFEVVVCEDGHSGHQAAMTMTDIKIIICDYNMPQMNGIEMIRLVRKIEHYKDIPVFMLTTESSKLLKETASEMGILAWIIKPFAPAPLVAGIKKALEQPSE